MFTNPDLDGTGVLIVGASGFIGSHLARSLRGAISLSRNDLDLRAPDLKTLARRDIDLSSIHTGIIAAAVSRISACEDDPQGTREANVLGTLDLAHQFAAKGVKTIWFSSDYVFDGKQGGYADDAPANPVTQYGSQKAEVELELGRATGGNCLILRLCKTYGLTAGDGTLLDEMLALLTQGRPVRAATDQIFNPTCICDVVRAVHELSSSQFGMLNCCAPIVMSRYDIARAAARAVGADASLVRAITLDELQESFSRPKNTSMLTSAALEHINFINIDASVEHLAQRYKA